MRSSTLRALRLLAFNSQPVCQTCFRRTFVSTAPLRVRNESPKPPAPAIAEKQPQEPEEFEDPRARPLQPLGKPIGFKHPPKPSDNDPVDRRTWRERRDDFHNYDKHLEKRQAMFKRASKGYYKDWANLKFYKGKTFLANPRIFKETAALYFPNIVGRTIATSEHRDTTSVLRGKVSIVVIFTSNWAENQVKTFIGQQQNPEIRKIVDASVGKAQVVSINVEDNFMKWWIIWASMLNLRRRVPSEEHERYFIVNKDLPTRVREALGLSNKNVGFVFLVDENCKIRWAGCGEASEEEREYLSRGLRRLLNDNVASVRPKLDKPKRKGMAEKETDTTAAAGAAAITL